MNKKLAVFDLDGTLLNTLDDLADACNYALVSAGFPRHPTEAYKLMVGNGVRVLVERMTPKDSRSAQTLDRLYGLFIEYYAAHGEDKTRPYPGIVELLRLLRENDVKTAVLSNKPHGACLPLMARYFPGLTDAVYGQRENVPVKPDPAALHEIMERFGVCGGECAYIGDSDVDMQTGRAGGLFTIGAAWGFRTKEELENAGAHAIVYKPEELARFLIDK